jgi:hypothetical protein
MSSWQERRPSCRCHDDPGSSGNVSSCSSVHRVDIGRAVRLPRCRLGLRVHGSHVLCLVARRRGTPRLRVARCTHSPPARTRPGTRRLITGPVLLASPHASGETPRMERELHQNRRVVDDLQALYEVARREHGPNGRSTRIIREGLLANETASHDRKPVSAGNREGGRPDSDCATPARAPRRLRSFTSVTCILPILY